MMELTSGMVSSGDESARQGWMCLECRVVKSSCRTTEPDEAILIRCCDDVAEAYLVQRPRKERIKVHMTHTPMMLTSGVLSVCISLLQKT